MGTASLLASYFIAGMEYTPPRRSALTVPRRRIVHPIPIHFHADLHPRLPIVANRGLYRGESLQSRKFLMGVFVVFLFVVVMAPLLMFGPRMAFTRRRGLAEYGLFAER